MSLTRRGFEGTLDDVARRGTVVQLHEDGDPIVGVAPPSDPVFVLSDHHDFRDEEAARWPTVRTSASRLARKASFAQTIDHGRADY